MTQQTTGGPRVDRDQMFDLDRFRRSATDRHIAGVAGGIGRQLDVDPTIVRVLLVVFTLFGGAGLLVYAAVWLFVPEDGRDRAPITVSRQMLTVILIGTAAIAAAVVLGSPFGNHGWFFGLPWPLLVIAAVVLVAYSSSRERRRTPPPPPWGTASPAGAAAPPEGTAMSVTDTPAAGPSGAADPGPSAPAYGSSYTPPPSSPPPAWMPPPPPRYVPPPKPRRTGLVLFWPTLALIAIGLGTLGILDTGSTVPVSAYAALALAVVAVMLLVGAFVGRPGGLIALGLIGSVFLGISSAADTATGGSFRTADQTITPTSSADVADTYTLSNGTMVLDLTEVRDLRSLDGRVVDVSMSAGQLTVLLPRGLDAHVEAQVRYAGNINLDGDQHGGFDVSASRTLDSTPATSATDPTLELQLSARAGEIRVLQG